MVKNATKKLILVFLGVEMIEKNKYFNLLKMHEAIHKSCALLFSKEITILPQSFSFKNNKEKQVLSQKDNTCFLKTHLQTSTAATERNILVEYFFDFLCEWTQIFGHIFRNDFPRFLISNAQLFVAPSTAFPKTGIRRNFSFFSINE